MTERNPTITAQPTDLSKGKIDTRSQILAATEAIMLDEGYAGVSSRKVATRAGLNSKLLHYYFKNMDELFIAAFQRREDFHLGQFASAIASSTPLHDIWMLNVDAASSKLYLEFNALACHRPAVREVISKSNGRDRITMAAALQTVFERYGISTTQYPPKVMAMTIAGFARAFATDRALGTKDGHQEVLEFVAELLGNLEPEQGKSQTD
ncbi:TetR/AcrR family transcriptional regulator [Novosphingobium album (ex Hu et al. 2023)]|uniref:TetR/AcrR family transcriptional regulator n=1 Tax=Novosphingobium album (ex Hu et al. 2023) TaxID=2930093 RepID=A0ABT0B5D3_9SPHN|nr:TetR/AcrR family transcriptional regulator [Novosphingobium album (ex Hu et al. 2023)]MCJ2180223.1 TetR/AcrR family transcriptional regulator [Novosphingobium album (ex Hu et al. 2023)]